MSEHQQGGVKMDLADVKFLVKSLKADIADLRHTVEAQHRQLAAVAAERDAAREALAELVAACQDQRTMCGPEWVDALAAAEAALADGDAAE